MIGKNEESKGSNLRFTDAFLCKDEGTTKNVLLKELGAPRPSYLQFYSEGGKSYNEKDAVIRGRKYYWHIPKAAENAEIYKDKTATNRNSTMELINTGNEFQFSVYYDSITEDQLRVLKYVLSLEDDKHMHKLGHGKPLGLGSVKIQILDDRRKVNDLNMDNYCINKQRIDNNSIKDIKFIDTNIYILIIYCLKAQFACLFHIRICPICCWVIIRSQYSVNFCTFKHHSE